jgi:hypothetical protein
MKKRVIIEGDARTVDNIVQENRIREEMGLVSIACEDMPQEKSDYLAQREKREPLRDKKEA